MHIYSFSGGLKVQQSRLWTKDFLIVVGVNFFTHVVFYALMTTVILHITEYFNQSQSVAGLAMGLYVIGALIARFFAGKVVEELGKKKVLIVSAILFIIALIAHQFATSLFLFCIIRFFHGCLHGFVMTATAAIAADIIPDERRGEGTGYYATAMNIAMAVGPFIGLYLIQQSSFNVLLWVLTVFAAFNLLSLTLSVKKEGKNDVSVTELIKLKPEDIFEKKAIPISIGIFTIAIAYSSLLSFLSSYATEINLAQAAGFFFLTYAAALVVTRPFTGRWFDKYGANKVIYPMLLLAAIGFGILSQASSGWMLLLAGAIIGIGYGTAHSSYMAIAAQVSPPNRKAMGTSTYFIFLDFATGVGPYIYGILAGFITYQQMYAGTAVWFIIAIGFYTLLHGKNVMKRNRCSIEKTV